MCAESVTIRFPEKDLRAVDALIKKGYFTNRSDAIRASLRYYMQMGKIDIPPIIKKMSALADEKGITREAIVKACREVRKELYKETYGR